MTPYLNLLDDMLREGARGLGEAVAQAQVSYVLARQDRGGGWAGRRGRPDLYYTEFALRLLSLLVPPDSPSPSLEALPRAARFLREQPPPRELVDVFSLLNSRRLLAEHQIELKVDVRACRDEIASRRSRRGGYGRQDGSGPTAYATFLAALSLQLLDMPMPDPDRAVAAIADLQQAGGGFAREPGGAAQTNSTAAALAFLLMQDALDAGQGARATQYLARMQTSAGGFASHDRAPADLLSTFTAFSSLALIGDERVDLPACARFVRNCAREDGGFGAAPEDPETDVEYTYYGTATLALLMLSARAGEVR